VMWMLAFLAVLLLLYVVVLIVVVMMVGRCRRTRLLSLSYGCCQMVIVVWLLPYHCCRTVIVIVTLSLLYVPLSLYCCSCCSHHLSFCELLLVVMLQASCCVPWL
jgi:hypothetical protein